MFPRIEAWGLDFAMPATFIGMVLPYIRSKPMLVSVAVAGMVALLTNGLPHKAGLMIASLAGVTAGVLAERGKKR
jgi:predicted branched-subunit amino acid permease